MSNVHPILQQSPAGIAPPPREPLTHERLIEVLDYEPESGFFSWKKTLSPRAEKGALAGSKMQNGYICISIDGTRYLAHRLAWLYVHGDWPAALIDHRDRCKTNNAIANLREASRKQNSENSGTPVDSTTGVKGVSWHPGSGKWSAQIGHNGKKLHLGLFGSIEEASQARKAAEKEHFTFHVEEESRELQAYKALLESMNWQFEFSDEHAVWARGSNALARLHRMQRELDPSGEIWMSYPGAHKHGAPQPRVCEVVA